MNWDAKGAAGEVATALPGINRRTLIQAGLLAVIAPSAWASRCGQPQTPDGLQTLSSFGLLSTAEEVTAGLDLTGKTAVVTGCNSGLGLENMRVLALRGAHVIGTARSQEKAETACASIDGKTTPAVMELTDFDSVRQCAETIRHLNMPIDMLICNAGVMAVQELRLYNGVEMQFTVNHLGHFLFVNELLPSVKAADKGRIVILSSCAHHSAPAEGIDFDNLDGSKSYSPRVAYGRSKLANGLHALELSRRLGGSGVTANAVHPGVIKTNLWRQLDKPVPDSIMNKDIPQGTATQCYVAANPIPGEISGQYFADCNPVVANPLMYDETLAKRLWEFSEQLTQSVAQPT